MSPQGIFFSSIHRDKSGRSDTGHLPDPDSLFQVDIRTHLDRVPGLPVQILDNKSQQDISCKRVCLWHPLMVDICPGDIRVEILIRIYNNDQQDILYNMSYRQHQLANYTFPLDRLFIGLAGRTPA